MPKTKTIILSDHQHGLIISALRQAQKSPTAIFTPDRDELIELLHVGKFTVTTEEK